MGCRTRWNKNWRDPGHEGSRTGGMQERGIQERGIQERGKAGKEECRKVRMQCTE